jgi:hypothetical protein
MKPESERPITIEDLLRMKRAERPPVEFWTEFDRKLRAKQLAALVEKRPWWQRLPGAFGSLRRYRMPLGACAIVGATVLSVRHYQTPSAVMPMEAAPAPVVAAAASLGGAPEIPVDRIDQSERQSPISGPAVTVAQHEVPVASTVPAIASDVATPSELSRMISLGGAAVEPDMEPQSPAARHIAANLAAVQAAEPVVTRGLLRGSTGFEARALPAKVAIDPLQQMTPPSDTRRSRLLTAMVSTASLDTSARPTERAASRIAEERLYDQDTRFGARGDRFNVKF